MPFMHPSNTLYWRLCRDNTGTPSTTAAQNYPNFWWMPHASWVLTRMLILFWMTWPRHIHVSLLGSKQTSKHDVSTQWGQNVGPTSATLAQHSARTGSVYRVCWERPQCSTSRQNKNTNGWMIHELSPWMPWLQIHIPLFYNWQYTNHLQCKTLCEKNTYKHVGLISHQTNIGRQILPRLCENASSCTRLKTHDGLDVSHRGSAYQHI